MSLSGVNFGRAAADYRTFRVGFPASLFDRLAGFEVGLPGQAIVDLGTGTGTLARGFAQRGCTVWGVDPDPRMLAQARLLDGEADVEITYVEATAEATGLPDGVADVVAAGQCWHWFDRPRALIEVRRLLQPGGKLVICHFDWLPLPGSLVEATEALILHYNPAWHLGGGQGLYPQWLPDLSAAGFGEIETWSYDLAVPYSAAAWRGRIRASAGVAALDAPVVERFDADLATVLARDFPAAELAVPHRVFAIVCQAPRTPVT